MILCMIQVSHSIISKWCHHDGQYHILFQCMIRWSKIYNVMNDLGSWFAKDVIDIIENIIYNIMCDIMSLNQVTEELAQLWWTFFSRNFLSDFQAWLLPLPCSCSVEWMEEPSFQNAHCWILWHLISLNFFWIIVNNEISDLILCYDIRYKVLWFLVYCINLWYHSAII